MLKDVRMKNQKAVWFWYSHPSQSLERVCRPSHFPPLAVLNELGILHLDYLPTHYWGVRPGTYGDRSSPTPFYPHARAEPHPFSDARVHYKMASRTRSKLSVFTYRFIVFGLNLCIMIVISIFKMCNCASFYVALCYACIQLALPALVVCARLLFKIHY